MPRTFPDHHFTTIDLTNTDVYAAIVRYWHDRIVAEDVERLLSDSIFVREWLARNPGFQMQYPDRFAELQLLLQEAGWITLQTHSTSEQTLPLFQTGVNVLFHLQQRHDIPNDGYDLVELCLADRLRERLTNIPRFNERDAFKKQLVDAMSQNTEVITQTEFFRNIKEAQGTVKNWLAEYVEYMGSDELMKSRHDDFFEKNDNATKLSAEDKKHLRVLFQAYHQLKISSTKQLGIEEEVAIDTDNGKTGKIIYGTVFLDDDKLKQQLHGIMKTYKKLAVENGWRDPHDLYELEPRRGVAAVTAKTSLNFKPDTATGPDVAATKGPDHFTEQDEAEVQLHSQGVVAASTTNYDQVVADIKSQLELSFQTPDQDKRFGELVVSVLRGLRDTMELKEYLVDLQLPSADIEAILSNVQQHVTPGKKMRSGVAPKLANKPTLAQIASQQDMQKSSASVGTTLGLSLPSVVPNTVAVSQPEPSKSFLPKLKRSRAQRRPMVDDVKLQPSMVMGPIDELRAINTIEFRRLSADPMQAADRIHDQITLLAEESIVKEAEGIDAFKQSPLNKLYLELGNESISGGKAVNDIIAERETKGTPTLSVAEFNAISDLNKRLRF